MNIIMCFLLILIGIYIIIYTIILIKEAPIIKLKFFRKKVRKKVKKMVKDPKNKIILKCAYLATLELDQPYDPEFTIKVGKTLVTIKMSEILEILSN